MATDIEPAQVQEWPAHFPDVLLEAIEDAINAWQAEKTLDKLTDLVVVARMVETEWAIYARGAPSSGAIYRKLLDKSADQSAPESADDSTPKPYAL